MSEMNYRYSGGYNPRPEVKELFKLLGRINLPLSVLSIIPESTMHAGLGAKYLTFWRIFAADIFIIGSLWIRTHGIKIIHWWILRPHKSTWGLVFILLFIVCSLGNKIMTTIKQWKGTPIHSFDRGKSIFGWLRLKPYITYALTEPFFLLSLAFWCPDFFVKLWLILCGTSLFIHTTIDFYLFGWAVQDRASSKIEAAEYQTKTVEHDTHVTTIVAKRR